METNRVFLHASGDFVPNRIVSLKPMATTVPEFPSHTHSRNTTMCIVLLILSSFGGHIERDYRRLRHMMSESSGLNGLVYLDHTILFLFITFDSFLSPDYSE